MQGMVGRRVGSREARSAPLCVVVTAASILFGAACEATNVPPNPSPAAGPDPGSKAMHRLSSSEYNATVQDVLGTKLEPATAHWRGGELGGFDNIASVLSVDEP